MTDNELVKAVQKGEAQPFDLWLQMQGLVHHTAQKFNGYAEMDDLMQESYLAFMSAVQSYDENHGIPFSWFLTVRLKQSLIRYIDNSCRTIRVPVHASEKVRNLNQTIAAFEQHFKRSPTDAELCNILEITPEQLQSTKQAVKTMQISSLDVPIKDDQETAVFELVQDFSIDVEQEVLDKLEKEELKTKLWSLVDDLPDRQAETIRKKYGEGKTLQEIGKDLGVTGSRAQAIEAEALHTLRSRKIKKQLSPYLDDMRFSIGSAGGLGAFKRTGSSSTERAALKAEQYLERLRDDGLI